MSDLSALGIGTAVDVQFLDVGQGDSTLIFDQRTQSAILVDCPAGREKVVEAALSNLGAGRLHAAILTHWDLDHYGGLLSIMQSVGCDTFYYNRDTAMIIDDSPNMRRGALLELFEPSLRDLNHRPADDRMSGSIGRVQWRLLAPDHRTLTEAVAKGDRNLASGVVRIQVDDVVILIGGDADGRVWQRITADRDMVACSVLRWPHHGGMRLRDGFDEAQLVAATTPKYVVISTGTRNTYGHPTEETVKASIGIAQLACTQVTRKCHELGRQKNISCGGTLSFRVEADGRLVPVGGWLTLDSQIGQWSHPMCKEASLKACTS